MCSFAYIRVVLLSSSVFLFLSLVVVRRVVVSFFSLVLSIHFTLVVSYDVVILPYYFPPSRLFYGCW